jgi:predicted metal-dependent peptidase
MIKEDELLAKASKELMLREPYWGFFLLMLNKVWDNKIPTAGVSKNGLNYQLAINKEFFKSLSLEHRQGLIQHECMHISMQHLTQWFRFPNKKIANIAMDIEINQMIDSDYLPEGAQLPETYPGLNLDLKAGTRYYYEKLMEAEDQKQQTGSSGCPNFDNISDQMQGEEPKPGGAQLPDHSTWKEFEEVSEAEERVMKSQLDRIIQQAADMTVKKQGTIPGYIKDYLIKLNTIVPPKFNWKGYIRRFVGTSAKVYVKKTRRKENIKFPDFAGIKVKRKQNLLLAIDTSGSVSNNELLEFMNEIHHIYKTGVEVTIIQCDTRITSIEPYKGNPDLKIHGRGGTYFDPVLEYFNANLNKFNSLIYFTDGEAIAHVKPRRPVLWVLSERSHLNEELPGKVIKLDL